MINDEDKLGRVAKDWCRKNKKRIKLLIADPAVFLPESDPITVFMAGMPGAGKTEFSKSLNDEFKKQIIRIDADVIRDMMRVIGYNGANASIFQDAVSVAVSNLYSSVIKNQQSAIIDGTFAYNNWQLQFEQSMSAQRLVEIYYIYQDPVVAWKFVKVREQKQGRKVPLEYFIHCYFASVLNVQSAKVKYGDKVKTYFAEKNYLTQFEYVEFDVNHIEKYIKNVYTEAELRKLLTDDETDETEL